METIIEIIAVVLGLIGIIGCIIPIIPGLPLSYAGVLLMYFLCNTTNEISTQHIIIWLIITVVVSILDYVLQPYLTKLSGGSTLAVRYSIAGMVAGMVFLPPIGIIIGPFIGALIAELLVNKKPFDESLLAAFGSFLGFLLSTGLKLVCAGLMLYNIIRFIF
ncbi:MAG: DUF456 domain-containing protein [Bacteroidales bacterium]|nr:DUF456 domain-containing protein [Bacteroidales bacterium]